MKNAAKLVVVSIFALGALCVFLLSSGFTRTGAANFAAAQPTPPKNTNTSTGLKAANTTTAPAATQTSASTPSPANANTAKPEAAPAGGKSIAKTFTLGKDSLDEKNGEVYFNHELHASSKEYSIDGISEVTCIECHHTDQAKSKLKPPYSTSERDEELTMAVWQKSSQKVSECRACHFQDGLVPDEKEMPTDAKGAELNNKIAYHKNCNSCHDAAFAKRPDLKSKNKKFATSDGKDCAICHKSNS